MSEFGSIAETGAKPGDTVICVSCEDDLRYIRYNPGAKYKVVDFHGRLAVQGQSHGKVCAAGGVGGGSFHSRAMAQHGGSRDVSLRAIK